MIKSLIFIVFLSCITLPAQVSKVEDIYQKCIYNSLNDKGVKLKKYTKDFENHLIRSNILKDSTSKSYFELFKTLGSDKWKSYKYNYSYIDSINKIASYRKVNLNTKCADELKKHKYFENSKIFKMRQIFLKKEQKSVEEAIKEMSDFLEENDFKLDFYKYRTFFFLEDLKGFYID